MKLTDWKGICLNMTAASTPSAFLYTFLLNCYAGRRTAATDLYRSFFITNTHLKWSYTNNACASVPFSTLFLTVHSVCVCINSSTEGGGHVLLKVHVQGTTCLLHCISFYSSPPSNFRTSF